MTVDYPTVEQGFVRPLRNRMLIGGDFVSATGAAERPTINPATGGELATVPEASRDDVDQAVRAARGALASTIVVASLPTDRERWLRQLADLMERDRESFAVLESLDNGMPIKLARGLVDRAITNLRYFAGWPSKLEGATITPNTATGARLRAQTLREPMGVVAAIIPWNASITSATAKLGPAVAAGNAVVLKPSEITPLTVLKLAELVAESDLPTGLINIVTGAGAAGQALAEHPDVDMIAFTGSTATGRSILTSAATSNLKRTLVELGGKSPNIIFADADLAKAVPAAARGVFGNSGQVCTAGARILVEESILEEVIEGVVAFAERFRVGPGLAESTQMGPLATAQHLDRVLGYVASGRADGARVVTGGDKLDDQPLAGGNFMRPTVLTDVSADMRVVREEIFGPVALINSFRGVEEAITAANDTEYGLAAGVWTSDIDTAETMSENIRSGVVWINTYGINDPAVPFGGQRVSGFGREYGRAGVEEYTQLKSVFRATARPAGAVR